MPKEKPRPEPGLSKCARSFVFAAFATGPLCRASRRLFTTWDRPKEAPPQVWGSATGPGDTLEEWVIVAYSKILPRLLAGRLRKSRMGGIHKKGPAPGKQRPVSGAPHWRDPQSSQVRQVRILSLLRSGGHAKLRIGGLHQKKSPAVRATGQ